MDGFQEKQINYNDYEVSFRRWLVTRIDSGKMSHQEARQRFCLPASKYKQIIRRWQERYSDKIHLSLRAMSAKERTDVKALEKRIRELEKQLERAQMKNVTLHTMKVLAGILFHSNQLHKTQNLITIFVFNKLNKNERDYIYCERIT